MSIAITVEGRRCGDRMAGEFTTTCAIYACHH